jgi:DNA repair protein RadC
MNVKLTAQQKSKPIYTATDVYSIMQPILLRENKQRRKQEYFWVMGIDDERYLQFVELLALGGQNRVHIKPAEAFRIAIQKNADYVIFVHNHPAGKLQPSPDDKDATDHLLKAAEVVDIKVVDHFIITETKYYSFAEAGLLKQLRDSSTYRVLHEDEVALMQEKMAAEARLAEKTAIAVSLLRDKMPIEFIVKHTGLKKKVVEGLRVPNKVGGVKGK